ncbi:hypothetical protein QAD02_017434 [Eretmocerus hayati]|uniref:Uncharacterized protein n=1 Tax=Eretmocerus hayati TaxID=131215 RepID=A0ACC2PGT9_9HYME|nr:hypothetical protein QAD02_017434 [Eretmocerus hayati]
MNEHKMMLITKEVVLGLAKEMDYKEVERSEGRRGKGNRIDLSAVGQLTGYLGDYERATISATDKSTIPKVGGSFKSSLLGQEARLKGDRLFHKSDVREAPPYSSLPRPPFTSHPGHGIVQNVAVYTCVGPIEFAPESILGSDPSTQFASESCGFVQLVPRRQLGYDSVWIDFGCMAQYQTRVYQFEQQVWMCTMWSTSLIPRLYESDGAKHRSNLIINGKIQKYQPTHLNPHLY